MKKVAAIFLILYSLFSVVQLQAQSCGNSGPGICVPSDTGKPGLESYSLPCWVQGDSFTSVLQFKMFDTINFYGQHVVDSVQFAGISNLPCGLCWASNQTNNMFYANQAGCLSFSGTANDSIGQYQLEFNFIAWMDGTGTPTTAPSILVNQAGILLWAHIEGDAFQTCQPVDTATDSTGTNKHNLFSHCTTAIGQINNEVSSLNLAPNPINSSAVLSFNAIEGGAYSLGITDITGKQLSSRQIQAVSGENSTIIERNTLTAGMYFLTLTKGKSLITRKFVVTD